MERTEKKLTSLLRDKKLIKDLSSNDFEKSLQKYNKLVRDGLTKPRGYNIQSIDDAQINLMTFNSSI